MKHKFKIFSTIVIVILSCIINSIVTRAIVPLEAGLYATQVEDSTMVYVTNPALSYVPSIIHLVMFIMVFSLWFSNIRSFFNKTGEVNAKN